MNTLCRVEKCNIVFKPYNENKSSKLYLELTTDCNLRCKHCFNNSGESIKYMSIDQVEDIYNMVRKSNLKIIEVILSGGEPLLHPKFDQILKLFGDYYKVKVLTNGTLINDNHINLFKTANCDVQITLNGSNSTIDSELRSDESFNRTIQSIKKIIDSNLSNKLIVTTTINRTNTEDIEELTKLLISLGVKRYQLTYIYKIGRANENWEEVKLETYTMLRLTEQIAKMKDRYDKQIKITTSGMKQLMKLIDDDIRFECFALNEEIAIDADGNITVCPRLREYIDCNDLSMDKYHYAMDKMEVKLVNHGERCNECDNKTVCISSCDLL